MLCYGKYSMCTGDNVEGREKFDLTTYYSVLQCSSDDNVLIISCN